MTSSEFVKNEINKLLERFPEIKCYYEFDNYDNTHYIKIESCHDYDKIEDYLIQNEIDEKFIENYPYEGLIFTNEDIINKKNAVLIKNSLQYEIFINKNKDIKLNNIEIKSKINDFLNLYYEKIKTNYNSSDFYKKLSIKVNKNNLSLSEIDFPNKTENLKITDNKISLAA